MAADMIRTDRERPGRSTASRARWRTLPRGARSKLGTEACKSASIKRISTIQTPYDSGDIRYSISGWLLQGPLDSTAM